MADLLKDNTNKVLLAMSLPTGIGMLSTFLFQLVDTYFVGQLGANALAALSFASTIYFVMVSLFMGLAVGTSIIVGNAFGAGVHAKVFQTFNSGMLIAFLLNVVLSSALVFFIDPIFSALGAEAALLPLLRAYTVPLLLGTPLLTLSFIAGSVLRASGNITQPEILFGIAGVINLVLDYGLIFGNLGLPEYGIQGAALATVISWGFLLLGMVGLCIKDRLIKVRLKTNRPSVFREIMQISTPTIVTQLIGPITLIYLTFILAKQSTMAVAAFGVAGRIETLLMIGILAVSMALTPFIAQNFGAKQQSRVEKAIVFGGKASTYLGLLVATLLIVFIRPIAHLFSENQEVIDYTSYYFYIVAGSYVFHGLYLVTTSIFNGLKLTQKSLRISLVRSTAFIVPFTLIGSIWGVSGIFTGVALGNVCGGFFAAFEMRKDMKRVKSDLQHANILQSYLNDIRLVIQKFK